MFPSRNRARLPRNSGNAVHRSHGHAPNSFSSSSPPTIFPRIAPVAIFFIMLLFVLFLQIASDIIARTRTVVGHNLEPTPWHLFQPKKFHRGPGMSARILRCSYLSCSALSARLSASSASANGTQNGTAGNVTTAPLPAEPLPRLLDSGPPPACPPYFRWIQEDLAPWAASGVSMTSLMEAKEYSALRIVIVGGRLYADYYYACVQSRAMFTLWGLLQLLRRYPGMVPDVDLMFDCMDRPVLNRSALDSPVPPPPLFRYCTTPQHVDIPFPDWSFWGWPEVNIGPWDEEYASIKNGSLSRNWGEKHPYAYWKGNPDVQSPVRENLLNCNDTNIWGARILRQDWIEEAKSGFEQSKLANQCDHRYKIYAEGYAWSVSLKYILSCTSLTLIIDPQYSDFLSRGLTPRENYWPISPSNLCPSIKYAVDWGNEHPSEAESIGKGGQDYMKNVSMDRVYDYMYHVMVEYSKLQDFKPSPPPTAQELCPEQLLCYADKKQREFLKRSVASPSTTLPCALPPPDGNLMKRFAQDKHTRIGTTENSEKV
ncbi:hypothetical protein H6P81_006911 [Aristolochia fimbriata]|uniref:Glycosyl transferase CAP10 domain-containing protein n=1 Tax=Aristolochia fimbriata TaxID=158543 RepID=A0AAV7F2I2_ARIFI|nr:hypothetical protein H6P81_006911 [Aristolochia fimbriata]